MGRENDDLNAAARAFAGEDDGDLGEGGEIPGDNENRASGVFRSKTRGRPRKRGQAPTFGPSKANRAAGGGHRDDPTVATRPLPDWMVDPSLLPKKPPGGRA